jgi:hypothetical protein
LCRLKIRIKKVRHNAHATTVGQCLPLIFKISDLLGKDAYSTQMLQLERIQTKIITTKDKEEKKSWQKQYPIGMQCQFFDKIYSMTRKTL